MHMRIVHEREFDKHLLELYTDIPYFRLKHSLEGLKSPWLPDGFKVCPIRDEELADHINLCYGSKCVDAADILQWRRRSVYCEALWIAVIEEKNGKIAASGIAELDSELGEGSLEWIQVAPENRGCGLGKFVVNELLRRLRRCAQFATVSGKCLDASQPEKLYRSCGFTGDDIWHILYRK